MVPKRLIPVILLATLLGGCFQTTCGGTKFFHPSKKDVLTQGTKDQMLAHNRWLRRQGCKVN